ncbi:MAG: TMEM43 family protein [Patescibacteria group bacterium]|jgi:hypothetical protein
MVDQYTTVTTKGYGSRIMESIQGVVIGFLLFIVSFGVLYWNEGRVDLSSIAKKSVEISGTELASGQDGSFVSASGTVMSDEVLGDGDMLKPGKYLSVERNVEMYAWVEKKDTQTKSNTGGSETTTTTYSYAQEWTSKPAASGSFHVPEGHTNPSLAVQDVNVKVSALKVGVYSVDGKTVSLPGGEKLSLTPDMLALPVTAKISADAVYLNNANPTSPIVGDVRESYSALASGFDGTVFGELHGSKITKYTDAKGNELYRVFTGGRAAALATMHGEFVMMLWIFRLVGFFMMWGGLSMILAPVAIILDFFPILGSLGKMAISIITLAVALPLAIITIIVSAVLHSIIALLIVLAASLAGVGYLIYKNKDKVKMPKMPSMGDVAGKMMGK